MPRSRIYTFWRNWTIGHPITALSILVVLGILAFQYALGHLRINTDTAKLIAPDAPFQQYSRYYEKAFSQDLHTLLLVVESDTPELTKSASKRLLRLLRDNTDHFNSAYIPYDNGFFRQNGLLYLDTDELESLSNSLSLAQPFIGRIAQETNLTGFFSILEDALKSGDTTRTAAIDLTSLTHKVTLALDKVINGENALLSWESMISGKKTHSSKEFIIVSPKFDYSHIRPAKNAIESINKAIASIQDPHLPAVKVWVTGEVALEDDELAGISTGTFTASIFSVVMVLFILVIAYRSILLTVATLITLALGVIFCGAFAAFSVTELNLISLAFAVTNVGLGVEYAIHFCLRYRDHLNRHRKERALRATLMTIAPSLLLAAGTTSIGLYAFIPTDYKGVAELGLLAGTSLFISLSVTLVALPALLKLLPAPKKFGSAKGPHAPSELSKKLATLPLKYAKPISLVTLVISLISIVLAFNVKTDFNPINLRDPDTESVIAFKKLMEDEETTPLTLTVLSRDESSTKILQQKLSALPSVDKTVSLFDLQPADQDKKLALIEEMGLMLGAEVQNFPQLKADSDPGPQITRLIGTIDAILPEKSNMEERTSLTRLKKELQDILIELDTRYQPSREMFIEKIQTALLGTLPAVMNDLSASLKARTITLSDLPPDIRDKWLSRDGLYRIQIFPKKDLNDLANLEEFITQVQSIAPETAELPIIYWESMREVIKAFQKAVVIALVAIALLLLAIRRSILDTALIMTPLILAGLFTMASATITGTAINFANIIALPLLLGLGVDNGIHMLIRLRHSLAEARDIYQSSTARAIFYGALTTSSGFGGLAFSSHLGIASMGLIITIGIFWIMVCTFIILPALSKLVLKDKENEIRSQPRLVG